MMASKVNLYTDEEITQQMDDLIDMTLKELTRSEETCTAEKNTTTGKST